MRLNKGAFAYCTSLTKVMIPGSVVSIGTGAFSGNSLTHIAVAEENTVYHSAGNCLIETGTKTLIRGCETSVIPTDGSVTSIGDYAFSDCAGLTTIMIPESVTGIGYGAFQHCEKVASVNFAQNGQLKKIESSAFSYCTSLRSVTLPRSLSSIGNSVFWGCDYLKSVTFMNTSGWYCIYGYYYTPDLSVNDATPIVVTDPAANAGKLVYSSNFWQRKG